MSPSQSSPRARPWREGASDTWPPGVPSREKREGEEWWGQGAEGGCRRGPGWEGRRSAALSWAGGQWEGGAPLGDPRRLQG